MSANRADGTAVPDGLRAGLGPVAGSPCDRSGGQGGCLSLWVGFCVWLCGGPFPAWWRRRCHCVPGVAVGRWLRS